MQEIALAKDNQIIKDILEYVKQIELNGFTKNDWYLDSLPLQVDTGFYVSRVDKPIVIKADITGKQDIQTRIRIVCLIEKDKVMVDPLSTIETVLLQETSIPLTKARMLAMDKVEKENVTQQNTSLVSMSIMYQIQYQTKEEF